MLQIHTFNIVPNKEPVCIGYHCKVFENSSNITVTSQLYTPFVLFTAIVT